MTGRPTTMTRFDVLDRARQAIARREEAYGPPHHHFKSVARRWTERFGVSVRPEDVAHAMVDVKLSRLERDPTHEDSWIDLVGYYAIAAQLTFERRALEAQSFAAPGAADKLTGGHDHGAGETAPAPRAGDGGTSLLPPTPAPAARPDAHGAGAGGLLEEARAACRPPTHPPRADEETRPAGQEDPTDARIGRLFGRPVLGSVTNAPPRPKPWQRHAPAHGGLP